MFPGIIDLPFRLLPVDNLITTPLRAFQTMIRGVSKIGRNSFIYANGELFYVYERVPIFPQSHLIQ